VDFIQIKYQEYIKRRYAKTGNVLIKVTLKRFRVTIVDVEKE